ncbi:MAG: zinc ABC transporter substrate-binding protein [Gammaproteobacteria bacterium]|nr:zinc ABC transporter substrate-binding protein [Gammaproteobacteria bacterium]MBK9426382.1 zinc ABC transporter substrate-binding protein [Gammaproteobacteria bacterium]
MLLHYIFSWIRRFQWAAVVGVLLWAPAGLAASGPNLPRSERSQILATIKPLTLIARDVAGDLAEVRQLLPDGASPHEYALRVSDRRLLGAADVVLWVGPVLEPYLNNAVAGMVPGRVLTAADLPGIAWPENASDKAGVEQGRDEHLWLDPRNARIIARALGQALVARSPDTAAAVTDRLRRFEAELDVTEAAIQARLAPLRGTFFASDHDGFGHFAHRFGLRSAGHLRDLSGHAAGARSVATLMGRTDVRCLVAEPDSRPERLQRVAAELGARFAVVDALGMSLAPAPAAGGGYAHLLQTVADGFAACLDEPAPAD